MTVLVLSAVFLRSIPANASARVEFDHASGQITVHSHLYFFGKEANKNSSKAIVREISRMWNEPKTKIWIKNEKNPKGKAYRVRFKITSSMIRDSDIEKRVEENTDCKNNFIRIGKTPAPPPHEHRSAHELAGNIGWINLADEIGSTGTAAHEYGHGLGLDHNPPDNEDASEQVLEGRPGIMANRGVLVESQYQWDPKAKAGEAGGTLDPKKRRVLDSDIQNLKLGELDLDLKNTACLGQASNVSGFRTVMKDKPIDAPACTHCKPGSSSLEPLDTKKDEINKLNEELKKSIE